MSLKNWSTTAGSNATVDSINFAENQAPSTVNDSARALMADVRTWYEDVEWRDWGHTVAYASATTFTIATDLTAIYTANRPIRCTDATTLYGRIVSSTYGAPNTTVTVILDSGSLSASLTAVSLGSKFKTVSFSNGLSSQSATASYATNVAFTDATATRTITVPDETGTLVLKDASTGIISPSGGFGPATVQNIGLLPSVAAKALTIALKTKALADPSAGSPVQVSFRNSTLTTGDYNIRSATAAASVVAPSGATLGFAAAATGYIYVYALDNSGTIELILTGSNNWDEGTVQSTTAITAGADSASILYSTTARSNVPIRYLGRIKIQTGAVAGEWDNEDTEITLLNPVSTPAALDNSTKIATTAFVYGMSGMHKLTSGTVSAAATLDIVLTAYTAYKNKRLVLNSFVPATAGSTLTMRFSTDGGSTYISSGDYLYAVSGHRTDGTNATANDTVATSIYLSAQGIVDTAGHGLSANITLFDTTNTGAAQRILCDSVYRNASGWVTNQCVGARNSLEDCDAIRLLFTSGNIASGTWTLYGFN